MNNIITLTTDWGFADNYTAIFKAHLFKEVPNAHIVDISHGVEAFNIEMGAYLLTATFPFFNKETIHVFCVDFLNDSQLAEMRINKNLSKEAFSFNHYLAVKYKGHYFLARNNGFFSLLCEDLSEIEEVVKLEKSKDLLHIKTFDHLSFLLQPAIALSKATALKEIGKPYELEKIETLKTIKPLTKQSKERGNTIEFGVKYIDNYGNIVTNLHKEVFDKIAKDKKNIWIYYKGFGDNIKVRFVNAYSDVNKSNTVLALFNISGYLEIATNFFKISTILPNNNYYEHRFTLGFEDDNEKIKI